LHKAADGIGGTANTIRGFTRKYSGMAPKTSPYPWHSVYSP